MRSSFGRLRWLCPVLGAIVAFVGGFAGVRRADACDTPVYRYAMYNWAPAPYRVYYFYRGEPDKRDADINRRLAEQRDRLQPPGAVQPEAAQPPSAAQSTAQGSGANVVLETIDVGRKDDVEMLPEPVKKAWEAKADAKLPMHFVFTSWGDLISAERLDSATANALVQSPLRSQIAQLLEKRHAAVFLLFCGKDAAANAQAEKVIQEVIARAAKGQITVEPADDDAPAPTASAGRVAGGGPLVADGEGPARPQRLQIGLVKLQRSDPAETCLVRSLSTVEREIPEAAGQPMVFAVFGRGRVLPPCIGKGITAENLSLQVELLAGPCSCNIRQNLGVDLLFQWDWEATAEALAADEQASADAHPGAEKGLGIGDGGPGGKGSGFRVQGSDGRGETRLSGSSDPDPRTLNPEPSLPPPDTFAAAQAWKFGLGLAAIAAGVLAVGLVLVLKHRDDTP
jgi:hypothetical protein